MKRTRGCLIKDTDAVQGELPYFDAAHHWADRIRDCDLYKVREDAREALPDAREFYEEDVATLKLVRIVSHV